METIKNSSGMALIFMLLLFTCAKNTDENFDEDTIDAPEKIDEMKETAIADWNTFLAETVSLVSITENNLRSLNEKAAIMDPKEGLKLSIAANHYQNKLNNLKVRLDRRKEEFNASLRDFDEFEAKKNVVFEKSFRKEMVEINLELEKLTE